MRDTYLDPAMALSRARHHVNLEAVCCAPVTANRPMVAMMMVKNVATALDEVAW